MDEYVHTRWNYQLFRIMAMHINNKNKRLVCSFCIFISEICQYYYSQYPKRKRDCFAYWNSRRAVFFSFYIAWYNDFLFQFYGQKKRFSSNWVSRHWLLFHIQRCPEDGPFSQFPMCYLVRWFYQNLKKNFSEWGVSRRQTVTPPDPD